MPTKLLADLSPRTRGSTTTSALMTSSCLTTTRMRTSKTSNKLSPRHNKLSTLSKLRRSKLWLFSRWQKKELPSNSTTQRVVTVKMKMTSSVDAGEVRFLTTVKAKWWQAVLQSITKIDYRSRYRCRMTPQEMSHQATMMRMSKWTLNLSSRLCKHPKSMRLHQWRMSTKTLNLNLKSQKLSSLLLSVRSKMTQLTVR